MIVILSKGGVSWLQVASLVIGPVRVDDGDHILSAILLDDAYSGPISGGLAGIGLPHVHATFAVQLAFYAMGLDWERWRGCIDGVGVAALIPLCVQANFGFVWSAYGDYSMVITQLKHGSMAASLAVIALLMSLFAHLKARVGGSCLGRPGGMLCSGYAYVACSRWLCLGRRWYLRHCPWWLQPLPGGFWRLGSRTGSALWPAKCCQGKLRGGLDAEEV